MRPHISQLLILALLGLLGLQVAAQSSCDPASLSQAAATKAGEEASATAAGDDGATATATATASGDNFPDAKILSQTPPIRAYNRGNPTVDNFYMMFPALGSLIHWGSLFPAYSFLGAPAPSDAIQAASSKVVLVLADDATAKTRVTRQNDPATPPNPFAFLSNFQNLPPLDSTVGQSLMNPQTAFSALQGLPAFSGLQGMLGAPAPVPPAATPAAAAPAADAETPPAPAPAPAPAAAAAATPTLAAPWNLPNFDANAMLGQTMSLLSQMPPVPAPATNLPPPNFDFLGQMFPTPAASDISEVRVRPEVAYASPEAQRAQLKIKSALEAEKENAKELQEEQERVPLLWFRMPSNPDQEQQQQRPLEDLRVEAKLKAFERQVIAELKLLQKIELMAKEMRSSASASGKDTSSSPYKIRYPLSRTPVHKITRSDIERALRDDYVRRLLQKEAQRKARITDTRKRHSEKPEQPGSMSKEDIVQIMAYAYRMASEQMEAADKGKQDKVYAAYRTSEEAKQAEQQQQERQMMQIQDMQQRQQGTMERQMMQQNPMERQMMQQEQQQRQMMQADPQANQQMIQQGPMMMTQQEQERQMMADPQIIQQMQQQRQWTEEQAKIQQQRQWSEEQAKIQQRQMAGENPLPMIQQNPMMMQQPRQGMADPQANQQMIQQNPMMSQQERQMMQADPQAIRQMQQQRQWSEEQAKIQQQRQWSEEQAKIQQNPMMMQQPRQMIADPQANQQNPMMMPQQRQMMQNPMMQQPRQMAAENPSAQSQLQWTEDPAKIQQIQMEQMQQRQWSEDQQMPAERQWADEKSRAIQELQQQQQQEPIVGEAGPQMAENEGKARHKVDALGLGGDKHKKKSKSSSSSPTVVNLYYSTPQQRPSYGPSYGPSYAPPSYSRPSYAPQSYARPSYSRPSYTPSYGTSYGGGGYGSNAYGGGSYSSSYQRPSSAGYRAAVGNDEVDEMLRQHQTMARTINPQPGPTAAPSETTTTTTEAAPEEHQIHKRLAIFQGRLGRDIQGNEAAKGCACGRSLCRCGSSCRCSSRGLEKQSPSRCPCKMSRRSRRSTAEYGTLETIDEGSLNELRREYKMGLKEITLSPDEDPAEALMRYNAASIREALERASQEPLEIGGDQYEGEEQLQEQEEQEEQHHHPHHHHPYQYHHQNFVRLTTAAPPPAINSTEASEATTEATPTTTTAESPLKEASEEMQQDSAAAESSRLTEAVSQQQEEIHELHKAVHALKMQLLDANRRCKKIQEQLKVNLVKEEPKEVPAEKKPIEEEKEKEQEKSVTEEPAKEEEQEPEADQDESTSLPTTTTETPPTTATPPLASTPPPPPSRSQEANAIAKVDEQLGTASASASASASTIADNKLTYMEEDDGTNWQRILANRGYDTDYLTKSHERQYAEGGNLELAKGAAYEAPLSQEYASYPDFQADEPAPAADSNDTEGKAKRAASAWSVKQRAHMLNVELNKVGGDSSSSSSSSSDTTPSPYAMRGKFLSRRSTARSSSRMSPEAMEDEGWVRSTRQARLPQRRPKKEAKKVTPAPKKVSPSSSSSRITTQASVSSTKLDRLVDVLNDLLRLQLQKERRASVSASSSSSSLRKASAKSLNGLSKSPKRLRRRPSATTSRSSTRTYPSSAPSATETEAPPPAPSPESDPPPSDPQVGSIFTFGEGLLHPFMGLLPVETRPDDPWNTKPYDLHHPLYTGGGSYAAYLRDGRRRRDTHIMGSRQQGGGSILTPGMLERLLRIKIDFQRRFPHLYKGMLNHHQNQTRVEVQPPVLGRISNKDSDHEKPKAKPKERKEEPVYELGAAERSLFEDERAAESDQEAEAETEVAAVTKESSEPQDIIGSSEFGREENDIDYFSFDDDDDDDVDD